MLYVVYALLLALQLGALSLPVDKGKLSFYYNTHRGIGIKGGSNMSTVNVTDSSLEQVIQNNKLVLVDFWAPWCGPCRIIGPILEQLADELGSEVLVAKLNVDDNQLSAAKYRIQGIPTLKLFRDGKEAQTFVGVQPLQTLKSAIKQYV